MTHSQRSWGALGECSYRVARPCRTRGAPRTAAPGCMWSSLRWHCSMSRRAVPPYATAQGTPRSISKFNEEQFVCLFVVVV